MSDYVDFLFDPSMPWLVGEEDETFANWCARYPDIDDSTDPLNPGPGMMDYASNSGFDNGTVNHVSSNWSAPANPSSMDNGVNGTTQFWQLVDDQALGQQLGFNTYDFAAPGHSTEPDLGFTTTAAVPNSLTAPGHRSGFPTINSQDEQGGMHQSHAASAPYRAQRPIAPYTGSLQAGAASLSAGDFDSSGFIGGQAHGVISRQISRQLYNTPLGATSMHSASRSTPDSACLSGSLQESSQCPTCFQSWDTPDQVSHHRCPSEHESLRCACGKGPFSRKDALKRHLEKYENPTKTTHHCHLCHRHGPRGFGREEHLIQHLKGYHRHDSRAFKLLVEIIWFDPDINIWVCPYESCSEYRDEAWICATEPRNMRQELVFRNQQHFDLHMSHMHDDFPFVCSSADCREGDIKSFKTKGQLAKHGQKAHGVEEVATRREEFWPYCSALGCSQKVAKCESGHFRCCSKCQAKTHQRHRSELMVKLNN